MHWKPWEYKIERGRQKMRRIDELKQYAGSGWMTLVEENGEEWEAYI